MSEADGIDDVVEGGLRAGLMAAARIGEQLARMREQEQRVIQQAEEHRARDLQDRFTASRAAARAQLDPVGGDDWWDKATPQMIERAHEMATAWKCHDPVAAGHAERIGEQVRQRHGIDVNDTGATEPAIAAAVDRAQWARGQAEHERSAAAAARGDEVLAGAAVAGANREDHARTAVSDAPYDSAERRRSLAAVLEGHGDREAVNARLVADRHQATPPPSAAVQSGPSVAQTVRTQVQDWGRTVERGLERWQTTQRRGSTAAAPLAFPLIQGQVQAHRVDRRGGETVHRYSRAVLSPVAGRYLFRSATTAAMQPHGDRAAETPNSAEFDKGTGFTHSGVPGCGFGGSCVRTLPTPVRVDQLGPVAADGAVGSGTCCLLRRFESPKASCPPGGIHPAV